MEVDDAAISRGASARLSVFDMFRLGIGPSSSHTVGPMRAASLFVLRLADHADDVHRLRVELYGSLGATGRGHMTDRAVVLGLSGYRPDSVPADVVAGLYAQVSATGSLEVPGVGTLEFVPGRDIVFAPRVCLDEHPNALRFTALAEDGRELASEVYLSVGGGFVTTRDALAVSPGPATPEPVRSGGALLAACAERGMGVAELMREIETEAVSSGEVDARLDAIGAAMEECIDAGCEGDGLLPGALLVPRRAARLRATLEAEGGADPLCALDWVNVWALAVNEENAAGHRVVTAPTNGAAGIVPAVLRYYRRYVPGAHHDGVRRFLLAAGAVGIIIKTNASISGAEVGCQGEVGSACAMAAAGLAEAMGGTPAQVENAAEIGLEHNLGLTCDPIGGLVQIPCIERNAIAAVKAINAARMALRGDGSHRVSLDEVIETMRQTGLDMLDKYKETSRGGLAVNVVEC